MAYVCLGCSVCDDVGGGGNWHHGHMKGSCSSSIFFLHAWCISDGQSRETHCSSV